MSSASEAMKAIRSGDEKSFGALLREDPGLAHTRDEQGVSLLMQALYHRQQAVVEQLLALRGEELDVFEAAALGRTERLASLLGADPQALDARSPDGFVPLHLASFFGQEGTAELLLARGADVEVPAANPMQVYPLHSAAAGGNAAIVRRLLAAGADPNTRQQVSFTPLMGAAAAGSRQMVEDLLAHGADAAARSDDGRTAADLARERGHLELVELLGIG